MGFFLVGALLLTSVHVDATRPPPHMLDLYDSLKAGITSKRPPPRPGRPAGGGGGLRCVFWPLVPSVAVWTALCGAGGVVLATSFIRDGCGLPTPPFGSRGGARPTPGRPRCACRALRGQAAAAGSGSAARSPGAVAPR